MVPPVQYLTVAVLMMAALGVFTTAVATTPEPRLPRCPPGTYLATSPEGRDECPPCPEGFYMDKDHRKRGCISHRVCKTSEELLFPGTATTDAVCTCKEGGRSIYTVDEPYGHDCLPCKEGTVRQKVTGPFDEGDTGCCAPGTKAIRDELGKLWCPKLGGVTPIAVVTTATNTSTPESFTAEILPWWFYLIIAGFAIIILIIIIIAIVVRRQRKQRSSFTLVEEGQSLTSKKPPSESDVATFTETA